MAGTDELERMIEHVAGDVQRAEENHDKLEGRHETFSQDVHDYMLRTAKADGEIAGYVKNAALDISVIRKESTSAVAAVQVQVKESSEALWAAVDVIKDSLALEMKARAVADKGHEGDLENLQTSLEGSMETMKVDLTGKIRMAGYAKIITFVVGVAMLVLSVASRFIG